MFRNGCDFPTSDAGSKFNHYNLVKYFDNKHWGLYNKLLGTIEFQKGPFNNWFYYTFDDAINYYFGL